MKPNIIDAVRVLVPNAQFVVSETKIMEWHSSETQPSQEDVDAKLKELQSEWDAQTYARTRATLYPAIGDQLDDLYKKGAFSDEMAAKIKKVKDDNPKPS